MVYAEGGPGSKSRGQHRFRRVRAKQFHFYALGEAKAKDFLSFKVE